MKWTYDDGGRKAAGFKGRRARDCVVRAIAIATGRPYWEVYRDLTVGILEMVTAGRCREAQCYVGAGGEALRPATPCGGVHRRVYDRYLKALGWRWVPTMRIGSGCRVHLDAAELPPGRLIARVSRHLVAVIDGVVHDTHDPTRGESRCVYGYYQEPGAGR